jgi:DNA modification methylase
LQERIEPKKTSGQRANELTGREWIRSSISVWDNIVKTAEEVKLGHPAIFPTMLVKRFILALTRSDEKVILDPFAGVGSTVLAAKELGRDGIGVELNKEYAEIAQRRIEYIQPNLFDSGDIGTGRIVIANSRDLLEYVNPESVDLVVTSPPYWDILEQRRTADYKEIRNYGNETEDLGKISDYRAFLEVLRGVFEKVFLALKSGKYCIVIVMDIRKKNRFYPFHSDIASFMQDIGFIYDDIIIWNRAREYNNLRPLGYPSVFRVNKVHEFCLIFKKPQDD